MDQTDEFFHEPGAEEAWSESHYIHFVDEAVQGHGRIGFYPNRGEANVWAFLTVDDAIYYVADPVVPPAEVHGLCARRPSYTYAHHPEDGGEQWRIEWRGEATRVEDPAAVLAGSGTTASSTWP